ncbi:MAG: hypothetical protein H6907_20985 [Hyphomicrobiales bacterium]|nr:hypothetical protein [Hyphomicrobiales bacterium]
MTTPVPFPRRPAESPSPDPPPRPDPALLADLRARIRRLERGHGKAGRDQVPAALTLGDPAIDGALPGGGLARAALHEVVGPPEEAMGGAMGGTMGAATGFCAALLGRLAAGDGADGAILWCCRDHDLYGPGLAALGLDPARLLLVRGRRDADVLWAMEEGLRSGVPAAVVGQVAAPAAVALRRLHLAAETGGVTGFLLGRAPADRQASPAMTRWRVAPLPGGLPSGLSPWPAPRWRLELLRCRGGRPGSWDVTWHAGPETDGHGTAGGAFAVRPPAAGTAAPTGKKTLVFGTAER